MRKQEEITKFLRKKLFYSNTCVIINLSNKTIYGGINMLNLIAKLFKKETKEIIVIKETFTNVEIKETLESWNNVLQNNKTVNKILIVNSKEFASHSKGSILNVEYYEGEYNKGYKEVTVGGVFTVPTFESLQDSNILYVPYFN